jgi:hypothetical protein
MTLEVTHVFVALGLPGSVRLPAVRQDSETPELW